MEEREEGRAEKGEGRREKRQRLLREGKAGIVYSSGMGRRRCGPMSNQN